MNIKTKLYLLLCLRDTLIFQIEETLDHRNDNFDQLQSNVRYISIKQDRLDEINKELQIFYN